MTSIATSCTFLSRHPWLQLSCTFPSRHPWLHVVLSLHDIMATCCTFPSRHPWPHVVLSLHDIHSYMLYSPFTTSMATGCTFPSRHPWLHDLYVSFTAPTSIIHITNVNNTYLSQIHGYNHVLHLYNTTKRMAIFPFLHNTPWLY